MILIFLDYPDELHDAHQDYPLAPERLSIREDMISEYQRMLIKSDTYHEPPQKLVPNLRNKKNYIIHYRNLQQYVSLGLKLTKVRFY